ncbi:MAG TPA: CAP domain-containing protein [Solirubrobacteraceae bacterium]|nr:CAP domain-containing protein [Solirubrobacteraceae bacterium]
MSPTARNVLLPLLLACLALALPATASAARCANAEVVPTAANIAKVRSATLCLLNAERRSRGRGRLRSDPQLGKAAQRFSAQMVRAGFFGHVSPAGSTLSSRVRAGTSYLRGRVRTWSLGENLAWGAGERSTPRSIVRSWMDSPGHRDNILDKRFRHIGIGVVTGAPADTRGQAAATYTTDFGFRARR